MGDSIRRVKYILKIGWIMGEMEVGVDFVWVLVGCVFCVGFCKLGLGGVFRVIISGIFYF